MRRALTHGRLSRRSLGAGTIRLVILGVIVYFVIVALAAAMWCMPPWRARALAMIGRGAQQAGERVRRVAGRSRHRTAAGLVPVARLAGELAERSAPWRWWGAGALVVLLAVPALALLLRQWHVYDGFDHTVSREVNTQIAELLRGEQLVPPPRLPPELFTTREVEQAHPLAASASRQWELLDAEFRQRLLWVFKQMRERHGIEMVLIEGWRSAERQAQLAGMGPTVTHAGAGQSYHQVGLAADCAFLRDGRIVISEQDAWAAKAYALYGDVAQSAGLTWGGTWRTLVDLGHVELRRPGALAKSPA